MNELDRRDDPTFDESLPGCHMVDSCSNIQTGEQFGRLLRHNFNRHFSTNRAPLGLHFHASWLKSKKEFKDELIKFIEEMLDRNDVYFVTMLQVRDTRLILGIFCFLSQYFKSAETVTSYCVYLRAERTVDFNGIFAIYLLC